MLPSKLLGLLQKIWSGECFNFLSFFFSRWFYGSLMWYYMDWLINERQVTTSMCKKDWIMPPLARLSGHRLHGRRISWYPIYHQYQWVSILKSYWTYIWTNQYQYFCQYFSMVHVDSLIYYWYSSFTLMKWRFLCSFPMQYLLVLSLTWRLIQDCC